MRKISLEEFERSELSFDHLTYEKLVELWCVSEFSDSMIADKCGVPKSKITNLRKKFNISLFNIREYAEPGSNVADSEMTRREEANAIVAHVFRNGYLEELHAGVVEEKLLNPKYSRITNDEMKKLMVECCEKMAELLKLRDESPGEYGEFLKRTHRNYCRRWTK